MGTLFGYTKGSAEAVSIGLKVQLSCIALVHMGERLSCTPCVHRMPLLEFFAVSGDFTRRLTSVRANSKFSFPLAGPEDVFSVGFYMDFGVQVHGGRTALILKLLVATRCIQYLNPQ